MATIPDRFVLLREGWLDAFCGGRGLNRSAWGPPREVYPEEAEGVLRAVDEGVIVIDDLGRCQAPGLRKPGQDRELIRVATGTRIHYGIEWFTHIAAVCELIVDYRWPRSHIDFETLPFDAVAYLRRDDVDPVLVTEAKKERREVDRMLLDIRRWADEGLTLTEATADRDYRKYWGLMGKRMWRDAGRLRVEQRRPPDWFWAVGPGVRRAFRVEVRDGRVRLMSVEHPPEFGDLVRRLAGEH